MFIPPLAIYGRIRTPYWCCCLSWVIVVALEVDLDCVLLMVFSEYQLPLSILILSSSGSLSWLPSSVLATAAALFICEVAMAACWLQVCWVVTLQNLILFGWNHLVQYRHSHRGMGQRLTPSSGLGWSWLWDVEGWQLELVEVLQLIRPCYHIPTTSSMYPHPQEWTIQWCLQNSGFQVVHEDNSKWRR